MLSFLKNTDDVERWRNQGSSICTLARSEDEKDIVPRMSDLRPVDQTHRFSGKPSLLGRGTYGVVTLMKHKITGKLYAVKTLEKEVVNTTNMAAQVELELSAQRAMDHVNVVKCWNVEADDSQIYLIMDYCANGDLFQRLRESPTRMLPEREVFRLFVQILAGVNHIHSLGYCHRDLKLENLLLDNHNNLKIADFGWVARVNGFQKNRNFCGTLDYLAPEMVTGEGHDWRVDNWAVGVLLYELSRGKPPFISTAHFDLLRRILDVDIHDDDSDFESAPTSVCTRICCERTCEGALCSNYIALGSRPRLRGLALDCLAVVKHFLRKDPNTRIELREVLDLPWFTRMLRQEYSHYLRGQIANRPTFVESVSPADSPAPRSDTDLCLSSEQAHAGIPGTARSNSVERLSIRKEVALVGGSRANVNDDPTFVVESESTPDNEDSDSFDSDYDDLRIASLLSEEEPVVVVAPRPMVPRALAWRSLTQTQPRESLEKVAVAHSTMTRSNLQLEFQAVERPLGQTALAPVGVPPAQRAVSLTCAGNSHSISPNNGFPQSLRRRYTGANRMKDLLTAPRQDNEKRSISCRFGRKVMSGASNTSWGVGGSDGVMSSEELTTTLGEKKCTSSPIWNVSFEKKRPVLSVRPLFH